MKYQLIIWFSINALICSAQSTQQFTVNFDYNEYEITPNSKYKLDSFLNSAPLITISDINLYGHCDSIGNDLYNDTLSLNRVNSVKNYLEDKGVPITIFHKEKGFGKRQPCTDNTTPGSRYLNRRVELIIKRFDTKPIEELKKMNSLEEKIKDSSTKNGTNIILRNMNFIGGRHVLLEQSVPALLELLKVLQDNPSLIIEIQGHICCTPGAEDGLDIDEGSTNLSVNRAKAIYKYLIEHGIDRKRLSYKGLAHTMPLVYPEDTEARQTMNRRVEIKIIRIR